jgi:hypothetical protein
VAAVFAVTVISVPLILTISGFPHTGHSLFIMLGGSNFSFGLAPQLGQAYPFIVHHAPFSFVASIPQISVQNKHSTDHLWHVAGVRSVIRKKSP